MFSKCLKNAYDVECIVKNSLSDSLFSSKKSMKRLFNDLLREKKGFKNYLCTTITLKKRTNNGLEIKTLTFNSKTKTVINGKYFLKDAFNKLINRIDQWTNEGSGWVIDKVEGLYINTANYESLSGSSYIPLPKELNNSMKGLINIKNKDLKCFMWCHIRLINPQNKNAKRINKQDKKIASTLDHSGINFPIKKHMIMN